MTPITVEGRFISPTQIELAQPVVVPDANVEIEIRSRAEGNQVVSKQEAALALLARMAARPSRGRSKEDIDRQIAEERAGWEHRR
jgi:hypothetical protein